MRYALATATVIGLGALAFLFFAVALPVLGDLGAGIVGYAPKNLNDRYACGVATLLGVIFVGGALVGIIYSVGDSQRFLRLEQRIREMKRIRAVPLSELIKGMKHDPDRWKEKV